ncbi:hypothetical protein ACTXT7_008116 [Hymenolepis weldensis]
MKETRLGIYVQMDKHTEGPPVDIVCTDGRRTRAWSWAQETLRKHSNDIRQPAYSEEKMESASTGDELWNAAQRQLLREGKIHGFLRMYWAKKILEWHAGGPEKALQLGIYLNDKYALDGTDPNGYVGH